MTGISALPQAFQIGISRGRRIASSVVEARHGCFWLAGISGQINSLRPSKKERIMRAIAIIAFGFAIFASTECHSEKAPWIAFAAKNKVMRWVGREFLVANPFKYKDRVIAFQAWFVGSIGDTAIFSDHSANLNQALSVQMMFSKLLKKGDPVVVAVQVLGPDKDHREDNLTLVDIYRCSKTECADFAKFNDSGEKVIADTPPVRALAQRTREPPVPGW
jgi:hypothetical protein